MLRFLALPILFGLSAPVLAAQIELSAKFSGNIAWPRAQVRDIWPEGCAPQVDSVLVEGRDVILRAVLPAASCLEAANSDGAGIESTLRFDVPSLWEGSYRVRYEVRRAPKAEPELHAFRLVQLGASALEAIRPETGLWWPEQGGAFDRAGPGLGLLMETQANTLSLTLLGYELSGEAQWSYGATQISGRLLDLELATLSEGRGPFEPYAAPKRLDPAGSVQIELLTSARANLWFLRPTGNGRALSVEPISMVRFSFARAVPQTWLGRWVITPDTGDAVASRHIDLTALEVTADGFALRDPRRGYRLVCTSSAKRRNSPPESCDLVAADGSREIRFDQPALFELRGRTLVGDAMTALKLNR